MKSVVYLIDSAPYGTEKAYGALHAAIVCLPHSATIGLYGDGAYLALASQDSSSLDAPNLSHFIYAYPEIRMIAHKQSLKERNLLDKNLIELVEIMDDEQFIQTIRNFDHMMIL
ncbi:MAG: DsrE family protein [Methanothrix sp.]|nr:DsrE family protein [Methanothrix sp.]